MQTKEITKSEIKESIIGFRELILHNDDYNTFDHVIDCLVSICGHSAVQAEQCAYLVHYNGKCCVKRGKFEKLELMFQNLKKQNLTVEIQ